MRARFEQQSLPADPESLPTGGPGSFAASPPPARRRVVFRRLARLAIALAATWALWLALRATLIPYLAQRYVPESFRMFYGALPEKRWPEQKPGVAADLKVV